MADAREFLRRLTVSIAQSDPSYPSDPPFNPSERYPEYDDAFGVSPDANAAYEAVRTSLYLAGLDQKNYGTPRWNPLGTIVEPGQTVVVKPNFVLSDHYRGGDLFSIITHPSVLRAVVDYVYKALEGEGRIIIADTPQMDCDFQELLERTSLRSIQDLYRDKLRFDIEILDLRNLWFKYQGDNYVASQARRKTLPGDPLGSVEVNLGAGSAFADSPGNRYYGADYDRAETMRYHSGGSHTYVISKTVLSADVLISVPKLKVHKKVGVTLNSKGFVGTVTNKNCLIHHTLGSPEEGGDQYPPGLLTGTKGAVARFQQFLAGRFLSRGDRFGQIVYSFFYTPYRTLIKPLMRKSSDEIVLYEAGNWHGNDSAWRMVVDLSRIILYADASGQMADAPVRRFFSIVDGIIGGEGNGPLFPDPKPAGVVLAGFNPLAVDLVACRLMGFDPIKLKWMVHLMKKSRYDSLVHSLNDIHLASSNQEFLPILHSSSRNLGFTPHPGWVGHLESS